MSLFFCQMICHSKHIYNSCQFTAFSLTNYAVVILDIFFLFHQKRQLRLTSIHIAGIAVEWYLIMQMTKIVFLTENTASVFLRRKETSR